MAAFQYQILIGQDISPPFRGQPSTVHWFISTTGEDCGSNLPALLNKLGAEGWEVVGIGDLGYTTRNEILLKKTI